MRAVCGDPGHLLGVAPHLPESAIAYHRGGGYAPLPDASTLHGSIERAGLDGRGGAGFPLARKLATVAQAPGPRVVVANGEEGEPASVKDRWLLRHRPHLVLDGLRIAANLVSAHEAYVYVSDEQSARSIAAALEELDRLEDLVEADQRGPRPTLVRVPASYVAGEETSVVRFIDGGEAKPTLKPPRPFESGVHGSPTLVSNVESLARLALAIDPAVGGAAGDSVLATVIDGHGASLLEIPATATIGDLLSARRPPDAPAPVAVLMGGFAGGVWPTSVLDLPLDRALLRERDIILGCGSVIAVESDDCVVAAATDVASYLAASSSGQCGVCVVGTGVVVEQLATLARGDGDDELLEKLSRRVSMMRGRGNCALPDAVEVLVRTLLTNFGDEVGSHLAGPCEVCRRRAASRASSATRFRVSPDFGSTTTPSKV